jgi:hypothetical protein
MDLRDRINEAIAETISTGNSKGEITDAIIEILVGEGYVNEEPVMEDCRHIFRGNFCIDCGEEKER